MTTRVIFGRRNLLLFGAALACAIVVSATSLPADAVFSTVIVNDDIKAAANEWTTVDVHLPEATVVTFEVTDSQDVVMFNWARLVENDYRFEWRSRTTDGAAVANGKYTVTITGGDLDEVIPVKVKNNPKKDDGTAPTGPDRLSVVADAANHIAWTKSTSDDMVFYRIYSAPSPDGPWTEEVTRSPEDVDLTPPAPGIVWYSVAAIDVHGNESPLSTAVSSDHVSMSQEIGSQGGVLAPTTGTIRLEVPPGAVDAATEFAIEQVINPPEANVNRVMVTRGFEVTPHGTKFDPPATLTLTYDIPTVHGLPTVYTEETTVIQVWDVDQWQTVPNSAVDRDARTITIPLLHLSLFQGASVTSPHGGYSDNTNLCGQCHTVHGSPSPTDLYKQPTQRETCYQCHDESGAATTDIQAAFGEPDPVDGSSTKTSLHPVPSEGMVCGNCHTPHKLTAESTKLLRISGNYSPPGTPIGNDYCYACHGATSTFEGGVHNAQGGVPSSGSGIQCVLCHDPHASDFQSLSSEETTCYTCHNASTPNTNPDLPFDSTELEYAFSAATNDYDTTDADGLIRIYHHPIDGAEQDGGARAVECASCHNSHLVDQSYALTTSKISDPGDTRDDWMVTWTDTVAYAKGDISTFCVECHQEGAVTAPFSIGTGIPYDVRLTDDSAHDRFTAAAYFGSSHGDPTIGNLACTACHDSHGSSNAYMLREVVISSGGVFDNGTTDPGPAIGTKTDPPVIGYNDVYDTTQYGILERFCTGCHSTEYHRTKNKICTECHNHADSKF